MENAFAFGSNCSAQATQSAVNVCVADTARIGFVNPGITLHAPKKLANGEVFRESLTYAVLPGRRECVQIGGLASATDVPKQVQRAEPMSKPGSRRGLLQITCLVGLLPLTSCQESPIEARPSKCDEVRTRTAGS